MGWCMHVNDNVTNTVLSMSTLLIALHIIRTAIINGLEPYRYVKYVLENIKSKPVDDLLPYSEAMGKLL